MTKAAELRELGSLLNVGSTKVLIEDKGLHIDAAADGYKESLILTREGFAEYNANNALSTAWHISPSDTGGQQELVIGSVAHNKEYAFSFIQDTGFGQRTSGGGAWATLLRMDGIRSNISGEVVIGASNATGFTTDTSRRLIVYRGDSNQVGIQIQNATTGTTAADGLGIGIDASEDAFIWQYESGKDIYFGNTNEGTLLTLAGDGTITYVTNNPRFTLDDDNGPNITVANIGGRFRLENDSGIGNEVFEVNQSGLIKTKDNLPEEEPVLRLDFKNSKSLHPYVTFTRASNAYYYGTRSVLMEENFMDYSENFNQWDGVRLFRASGQTDPNGGTDAYRLTENTDNDWHYIFVQDTYIVNGNPGTYTWSVYAKAVSGSNSNWLLLRPFSTTDGAKNAWFDLANGALGSESGEGVTRKITDEGNGWYRCSITAPWTGAPNYYQLMMADGDGATQYQGDGTSSIDIFGAQLEEGQLGPYVKTDGVELHNYAPVMEKVSNNIPRFDNDPETREPLGILIEEERQNFVQYSEDGQAMRALGLQGNGSPFIDNNAAVAPDGKYTAFKSKVNRTDQVYNYAIYDEGDGTGTYWTGSMYIKKAAVNGHRYAKILVLGEFNGAKFDLDTGTVSSVSNGYEADIEDVGGGWYRCWCRNDGNAANDAYYFGSSNQEGGWANSDVLGSGNYMWGVQLERGPSVTSYIYNNGSSSGATRVPDDAIIEPHSFNKILNGDEFSVYGEWSGWKLTNAGGGRLLTFGDGTGRNQVWLIDGATALNSHMRVYADSSYSATFGLNYDKDGNNVAASSGRAAFAMDHSSVRYANYGTGELEDTSIKMNRYNRIKIGGQDSNGTNGKPNGHIQRIVIWNKKLAAANIKELTEN